MIVLGVCAPQPSCSESTSVAVADASDVLFLRVAHVSVIMSRQLGIAT